MSVPSPIVWPLALVEEPGLLVAEGTEQVDLQRHRPGAAGLLAAAAGAAAGRQQRDDGDEHAHEGAQPPGTTAHACLPCPPGDASGAGTCGSEPCDDGW